MFRRVAAASNKTRVRGDHGYAGGKKHPKEILREKEVTAPAHPGAVTDHGYAGTSSRKTAETLEHRSGERRLETENIYKESPVDSAGVRLHIGVENLR